MKVSIIIPIYNVGKYLPQCLDSLLAMDFNDWEAILVDDGSKDNSGTICDQYAEKDSRFLIIHQKNAGAANAKNAGLDQASGEYVAFLDSDDYVESAWLSTLVSVAEQERADIIEYRFDKVYRTHRESSDFWKESWSQANAEQYLQQYLAAWSNSLFWNKLFRKSVIGTIRFRKERRCIDDEFFTYKIISNSKKIVRVPDVLYHYRQRASSAVSSEKNQFQITDDAMEVLIERYEWISKRFPALRKTYIQHDVEILFFFAGFHYTSETVKKFRKTAKYYLKESIRNCLDIRTIYNALRLQRMSAGILLDHPVSKNKNEDLSDYFE